MVWSPLVLLLIYSIVGECQVNKKNIFEDSRKDDRGRSTEGIAPDSGTSTGSRKVKGRRPEKA